jgi:hypothetical protein
VGGDKQASNPEVKKARLSAWRLLVLLLTVAAVGAWVLSDDVKQQVAQLMVWGERVLAPTTRMAMPPMEVLPPNEPGLTQSPAPLEQSSGDLPAQLSEDAQNYTLPEEVMMDAAPENSPLPGTTKPAVEGQATPNEGSEMPESQKASDSPNQDYSLLVTLWRLRDALQDGGAAPRYVLVNLQRQVLAGTRPKDQKLRQLVADLEVATHAGLPTKNSLQEEFADMATDLSHALRRAEGDRKDETFLQHWLGQMVRVRRVGEGEQVQGVDGWVYQIEQAMQRGDMEAAYTAATEVKHRAAHHASDPVFGVFLCWYEAVGRYVKAHELVQTVFEQLTRP